MSIYIDPNYYNSLLGAQTYTSGSIGLANNINYPFVGGGATAESWVTTTTSTGSWSSQDSVKLKRCRSCNHGHMFVGQGCVEAIGGMIAFVNSCSCKEYVPSENLEYLEWCYDKLQKGK